MEINFENLNVAIAQLRKCADEHRNDITDTGKVNVSYLCDDVADFLETVGILHHGNSLYDGRKIKKGDIIKVAGSEFVACKEQSRGLCNGCDLYHYDCASYITHCDECKYIFKTIDDGGTSDDDK